MENERPETVERNRETMEKYWPTHDPAYLSEDVVFRVMATGQEHHGRDAVAAMFDYFYGGGAFEAHAETRSGIVDGDRAAIEADLVGRHTGEFAGVSATGNEVRVPFAVHYDVRDGEIVEGRVYFEVPVFLAQVGALPG
jgi:predicted ester cyclase